MDVRLLLSSVMIIGCTLCGRAFSGFYSRRSRLCGELLTALRVIRIGIIDRLEPAREALRESSAVLFVRVAAEISETCDIAAAWLKTRETERKRGGILDCFGEKELSIMDRLFGEIGTSGREEQQIHIRACIAEFEILEENARKDSERTEKLYTYMGMLLGLALAVLTV